MSYRTLQLAIAFLLVGLATGCLDPKDRRPGLRLSGEVVTEAIDDWSFSDEFGEIYLETRTWYVIPHSVTTVCAALGEKLYLPTIYYGGGRGRRGPGRISDRSSGPRGQVSVLAGAAFQARE